MYRDLNLKVTHCSFQFLRILIEGHTGPTIDTNLLIEGPCIQFLILTDE